MTDLAQVLDRSPAEVTAALGTSVDEGYIASVAQAANPQAFEFRHEVVQRAAYLGLSHASQERLHQARGTDLRASHESSGSPELLFEALTHLNRSHALRGAGEDLSLAQLNLKAALMAKESTAYGTAAHLLRNAEGQLSQEIWIQSPETAFRTALLQAECAYLAKRIGTAESLFDALLTRLSGIPSGRSPRCSPG